MKKFKSCDIIHIRDYYPSIENPASSPWVYDIVSGIQNKGLSSLVISPTPYIPDFLRKKYFYLYPRASITVENYKNTFVIRPQYYKIPKNLFLKINLNLLSKSILNSVSFNISPKLIHAHFGQNGVAALELKKKYNVPLVTSFYGYDTGRLAQKFKPYYKELISNGDLFLALSEDMKNDLISLGFPEYKILVHHLGINLEIFKNVSYNKQNDKFIFLIVARFDEAKGIQDVIRAFKNIHKDDMELRIVGDGVYKKKLIDLTSKLNLKKNIKFINNFKDSDPRGVVIREMQNCDVFLLTSFTYKRKTKEGTPVVLMEAQACGKPCISTKHAGIPEVVIDKKTGFLINENDINSISKSMIELYKNIDLKNKLGNFAIKHIYDNFNQNIQINKLNKIYLSFFKN